MDQDGERESETETEREREILIEELGKILMEISFYIAFIWMEILMYQTQLIRHWKQIYD